VVLSRGQKITARDLPQSVREAVIKAPEAEDPKRLLARSSLSLKEAERELIVRALKATDGSRTLAARKLGMSRRNFHRKLHQHHLEGF
jgi:DNA-binding NtrC family response regulator